MTTPTQKTIFTTNALLIVCKAEFRNQMNTSLATVDSSGSTEVLNVPLTLASSPEIYGSETIVAYWTNWAMDDTQRSNMNQLFGQQGWRPLRGSEGVVLGPTDPVPSFSTNQRFWTWNGRTVLNSRPLLTLGLRTMTMPPD